MSPNFAIFFVKFLYIKELRKNMEKNYFDFRIRFFLCNILIYNFFD